MVESHLSSKVELFICARDVQDMDAFSKSDPFCVVYSQNKKSSQYFEVGRTEVIMDNLNPNWSTSVTLDFLFETKQLLKFSVFDYDESRSDHLGDVFTSLGDLVGKGTSILNLTKKGKLIIRVEEVKQNHDLLEFHLRGIKLDKKDFFGKSDPYLIFYKSLGQSTWTEVCRTEIIKNTLDPIWKPLHTSSQKLCNGDLERPIKVECYDWNRIGSHDIIGAFETNLALLTSSGASFTLANPEKKGKPAGKIEVKEVIVKKILSFIDYLRAGVQLSFTIAIDFTGSNGEYSSPSSLHHINPNMPNQYERAIWEVGSILEAYDTDKFFPVFGFGGVPAGERSVNHCFPLTFDKQNPYVMGTTGIIDVYHGALRRVSLSGPTLFHHVIDQVSTVARSVPPQEMYSILLILTDGAIMDMKETIKSVVAASVLPLSIIIVGVGNADFTSMEALDCDDGFLHDECGYRASRDIVQFVPFNKYSGDPVLLTSEVLKEVPKQLTEFMSLIKYFPAVPEPVSFDTIAPVQNSLPPLDLPSNPDGGYEYVPEEQAHEEKKKKKKKHHRSDSEDFIVPDAPME